MTKFATCFKYFVSCYDTKIGELYENKAIAVIFADSEEEAIEKAQKYVTRKFYAVYEVAEIIDSK